MLKNKSIKLFFVILIFLILVSISIVKIIQSKSTYKDINVPSLVSVIPDLTFTHIKQVEEDDRTFYYYHTKNNQGIADAEVYQLKLFTFEIKELFIHDSFNVYTGSPVYKEGDLVQIALPIYLCETLSGYDEFIVKTGFFVQDIYTENREQLFRNVYLLLPLSEKDEKVILDDLILPVKDNKLSIQYFINQKNLTNHHMLLEANSLVDDPNYQVQDGLTIENLREYFKIVVDKLNGCDNNGE